MSLDTQVQNTADSQYRPRCESIRALYFAMIGDRSNISDVYNYLTGAGSGWTDASQDAPPHILTAQDVLSINSLELNLIAILSNTLTVDADKINAVNAIQSAMPVIFKSCVRPVQVG